MAKLIKRYALKPWRTIGDALTQHEPKRVKDKTQWVLERVAK